MVSLICRIKKIIERVVEKWLPGAEVWGKLAEVDKGTNFQL